MKNTHATEPDYTTGTPWLDCDLDGNVTEETEVSLKDHFDLAVNKERILSLKIPEGYASGGTTRDLILQNVEDTKKMFLGKSPDSHDAKLAYDLFWLMMDWDSRNARGIAPLKEATDKIEAIDSIDALTAYFLETPSEEQLASLWSAGPEGDFKDSTQFVLVIARDDLLLDDAAEYSKMTDYGRIKKDALTELAKKMLQKLGYTEKEAMQKIDNCFAYETLLAPTLPSAEKKQSPEFLASVYNIYSCEDAQRLEGNVPILQMLEKEGFPKADRYLVAFPDFVKKLNELYIEENLTLMKDYMIVYAALENAEYLDRECYEWKVARDNAITGASGMLPDEDVFASDTAAKLKWPVGRFYTEVYLRQEDKDRILRMMEKIIAAYHGIIDEADFLSDTTKVRAIEKLDALKKEVLFPDSWEKYESAELDILSKEDGGTLWDALKSIRAFELAKCRREYSEPYDKDKWDEPPNTVNCGYLPTNNTVYINGGFTQGLIYSSEMSDEQMLGTLGWVIGHEVSHAFDINGSQFDKDGNMITWWTEEDLEAFQKRNAKMEAYYNNMHPWEGQDFYGSIMTGEGCADMGGMKVVLSIAAENRDFDYDTFFRSLAVVWLEKGTLQAAYRQINDVHPMGYLRVNCTLQQFDKFLDFYGIKEGDGMYLAPEDRVLIW